MLWRHFQTSEIFWEDSTKTYIDNYSENMENKAIFVSCGVLGLWFN